MRLALAFSIYFVLIACSTPATDPSFEILDRSKGVVGKLVTIKSSPTIKTGSLSDAVMEWEALGWARSSAGPCKALQIKLGADIVALERTVDGDAMQKVPTYRLRLCAGQVYEPKAVAVGGYVVETRKALPIKP